MTMVIDGTAGGTFPDGSVQNTAATGFGFKNRIINGGFTLNQRVYVSGTALAAGAYGHDRFKGGASGGTYTFTQGALGVNIMVTITAGTLVQIIEGCNVAEGGTYVLSWLGTAQGRLNGGTYGASGTITVTGWVAGTNLPVEFNTGTVGSIQLEKGSTATAFDYRDYGRELIMCQRYGQPLTQEKRLNAASASGTYVDLIQFVCYMRTNPSVTLVSAGTLVNMNAATISPVTSYSVQSNYVNGSSGDAYITNRVYFLSAEL